MRPLTETDLVACVDAATRAPSIHNTQPWLFRLLPDGVEVHADLSRRLPAVDAHGRAMHISLGAAILNLRVALAHTGRRPYTELLPDPADRRHVATVRAGAGTPDDGDGALFAAIARRRSNRMPFEDVTPPAADLTAMEAAARTEGARLSFADPAERDALLSLARSADVRMRAHPEYRDELRRWTTDDPYREDGVPIAVVGPWSRRNALPIRDLALDRHLPERESLPFEREPTLATLATAGDGPRQWLVAGQALERVLLEATRRNLAASLFTQPLEDPRLRDLLTDRTGRIVVQAALRVGYGPPVPASPRRPPAAVIAGTRSSRG